MLQVSRTSWHSRIYAHWYKAKYDFSPERATSLCPYMRVIMFWAPARFFMGNGYLLTEIGDFPVYLSMVLGIIALYAVPTALGYFSYNAKLTIFMVELVLGTIITAMCLIAGTIFGIKSALKSPKFDHFVDVISGATIKTDFFMLLREYIRAGHDRICPTVEFKD